MIAQASPYLLLRNSLDHLDGTESFQTSGDEQEFADQGPEVLPFEQCFEPVSNLPMYQSPCLEEALKPSKRQLPAN